MKKPLKVLIMAGGTGGHIYPALACAEFYSEQQVDVVWMGSKGGMEEQLVEQNDIKLHTISIKGIRGKGLKGLLLAPFRILYAIGQALSILRYEKPDVVLGMGGFVAGPGGVAAKLLAIPLVIHEQNAIAGTTNKLLSRLSSLNLCAFDGALSKGVVVGNPVRQVIINQSKVFKPEKTTEAQPLKVLVIGGSLGARRLNQVIPELLHQWGEKSRLDIWHQTGKTNFEEVRQDYCKRDLEVRVDAYIENMEQAYYWADIVVCRAGAMTISELAIFAKPSILVPYPYAIDDHQTHNALSLVNVGGAFLVTQQDLSVGSITLLLSTFAKNRDQLIQMGKMAHKMARPDATNKVVSLSLRQIK